MEAASDVIAGEGVLVEKWIYTWAAGQAIQPVFPSLTNSWCLMRVTLKPAERLPAGAGALSSLPRCPGLGERISEHTEEGHGESFGTKGLVPFKNKKKDFFLLRARIRAPEVFPWEQILEFLIWKAVACYAFVQF